jgi:hypothetical protein
MILVLAALDVWALVSECVMLGAFVCSSDINGGTTKAPTSYRNDTEADIY